MTSSACESVKNGYFHLERSVVLPGFSTLERGFGSDAELDPCVPNLMYKPIIICFVIRELGVDC